MTSSRTPQLILASKSPARAGLLRSAGLDFTVLVSAVDEPAIVATARDCLAAEGKVLSPADEALLLAQTKAEAVASRPEAQGAIVIGCDSVFELDNVSYGKPYTVETTVERWQLMRGNTGLLHTGHAVIGAEGKTLSQLVTTAVHFGSPTDEEIRAYAETGEPLYCAGAFSIDGRGASFVQGVEGDYHSVIGISPATVAALVGQLGYSITNFWNNDHDQQETQNG